MEFRSGKCNDLQKNATWVPRARVALRTRHLRHSTRSQCCWRAARPRTPDAYRSLRPLGGLGSGWRLREGEDAL